MRATEAPSVFASSTSTTTLLMSLIAGRRPTSSGAIRIKRPGAGWLKSVIAGSTAFANCSSDTKSSSASFVALNHLAAAIIAFRKVPLDVNIIYG